jgi:hypothetical protein
MSAPRPGFYTDLCLTHGGFATIFDFQFDMVVCVSYMGGPAATALWAVGEPSGFRVLLDAISSLLRGGVGIGSFLWGCLLRLAVLRWVWF